MRAIQDSILYAQQQATVVGALAVFSVLLWLLVRRFKALPICVLMVLIVHPVWTISAVTGDCGCFKANAATFVTAIAAVCVVLQCIVGILLTMRRYASEPVL